MKRSGPLERRTPLKRGKPLARSPIAATSTTSATAAKRDLYRCAKARVAVRSGGRCEARLDGCTGRGEHFHHRRRRRYDPFHKTLMHSCLECHGWVHANPAESYRLGLLLHNIDVSGSDPWTPPSLTAGRARGPVTPNPLTVADPPPNSTIDTEDAA